MAVETVNKENTNAPDSDFLGGSTKDDDGTGNGTPANRNTFNDFFEFFTKLLSRQSITPNGVLENEYAGHQYHDALDGVIADAISAAIAANAWVNATLAANTVNTGSVYADAGYVIDKFGRVNLRGRVTYTGPSSGSYLALFTLPAGYRPPYAQNFICEFSTPSYTLSSLANSHQFSVQVDTSGVVKLIAFVKINPGDNIDISLDGISFLTY